MRYEIKDVFHPSDFTRGSALAVKGRLEVFHSDASSQGTQWVDFPSAFEYLRRWKMIPPEAGRDAAAELGLYFKKIQVDGTDPSDQIVNYLVHHRADLIVLSTHQRKGLERWMHRAVAEPVTRSTEAMSLFVPRTTRGFISPATGRTHLSSILIPIDAHPAPQRAVDAIITLAHLLCGSDPVTFTLLFAGAADEMPKVRFPPRRTWQVVEQCVEGEPEEVILDAVKEFAADLIVMATEGKKGFLDALRGTVTERIVRSAPCPVLTVPAFPS
jgi:nucleotide-binding universal stress UspA family protein